MAVRGLGAQYFGTFPESHRGLQMVVHGDRQVQEVARANSSREGQQKLGAQVHQRPGGTVWCSEQNHHRQQNHYKNLLIHDDFFVTFTEVVINRQDL